MNFKLISLDCEKIVETSILKIEYMIQSDTDDVYNLKVTTSDIFFNLNRYGNNEVHPNITYFTEFNYVNDVPGISDGFNIVITNDDNNEILFQKKYEVPNKNIWIFGDSHTLHIKDDRVRKICENNGYNLNCVGAHSLSLNRFVNGNFINYLQRYNIKTPDYIVFYLGEIDFRFTIHKHCQEKDKNIYQECYGLMIDYLKAIISIKKEYPNEIIILSPNPTMRDLYLDELVLGTEDDRKICWDIFNEFWKKTGERYLDWTDEYKLDDGMINCDLLIKNDHHINDYTMFIEKLIKWF